MSEGQARALADDDHVPWSRPPRRGHCDFSGHCMGRPVWAGPDPGAGAGRGPDPAQKADREGQGRGSRRLRRG
jgi:hypothetical protein